MKFSHDVLLVTPRRLGMVACLGSLGAMMSRQPDAERVGDGLFEQAIEFCLVHDDVSVAARD